VGGGRRGGPLLSADTAKGEVTLVEPSAAERAVARRAAESRATVPALELVVPAPPRPAGIATLVHASALALREHPRANAAYRDGRYELYSRVNVGVLVSTAATYAIPTVFDADRLPVEELEEELERLERETVAGALAAPAFGAATFTVWDAAAAGLASASIPVVAPQAAALVAGTATLTLCCDHRILYGARAAAFLKAIAHHLDRDGV
jgi:pyruvate dehydrogenase E2 component (dihydrolipoamide acetyltransferase)